ncbi:MAG TPA: UDP-N-acetylmuramoyl-L-alanyl-D-glutamate--2,6-diaminopimelate ligase, partial [Jiangellaceae bacterium]|nr:UDP-N-acetylmuramoyl-L-alanyl-D-glutamate--2,6-diaminopimelate ligase [Jiangellaceae bacterium]
MVTGITHDSRQVRSGDLYAALPGALTHGARFGAAAAEAGAAAVLTDHAGVDHLHAAGVRLPTLVVTAPRVHLGTVAAMIYGHPARDLLMLGITGTNGKTTTAYLLDAGLRAAGESVGLIGTVETRVGDEVVASVRTTPEATDVHALLAVMRERGVTACAMEVSSHALVYGRVDGIVFDVVGFTNLSQDHLDFHADLDDYFAAKASLFTPHRARRAVICVDDEYGRRLADLAGIPAHTVATLPAPVDHGRMQVETPVDHANAHDQRGTVGATGATGATRATRATGATGATRTGAGTVVGATGATWTVIGGGNRRRLRHVDGAEVGLPVPLPGQFNVANAALAVAMLIDAGIDSGVAATGVGSCAGVPGRMQQVSVTDSSAPLALVDYAHTPDAVANVLAALHPAGRLIVVVGAGGDRDPHKRPLMGAAAARGADVVIVTDDNPRSEDPAAIRAAVVAGATSVPEGERAELIEVADRRAAIRAALESADGPADTVVVLGKGHEQGQEI